MKIDWVRNEIARMRGEIGAQECEIRILQRAVASTVSARRCSRGCAKVDGLCKERADLWPLGKKSVVGGNDP
jgi:hypothetical protein